MDKPDCITVTEGMSGFFAIHIIWVNDPELGGDAGGYWDVWQSGVGRYDTKEEAIEEAKEWAESEGIEYKEPKL